MAHSKSAVKRIRTNERNRVRNVHFKSRVKTSVKAAVTAATDNQENQVELLRSALRLIDDVAGKGIMHKNKAARSKSRLMAKINKLTGVAAAPAEKAKPAKKTKAAVTAPKSVKKPAAKKPAVKKEKTAAAPKKRATTKKAEA